VKFTEAGGRVTLRAEIVGEDAHLIVQDTGTGIPADHLESIFEPFVQVGRGLSTPSEGTGLGLAISRDLARAMGGELWAESQEGAGSTFTVRLPLAKS
jgi:signal transduction histidine kinase